ncbi:MAG: hypothetical protein GXO93_08810 [FCB group bacterium]|nr:hypothetical protein [FCB group bacterium]
MKKLLTAFVGHSLGLAIIGLVLIVANAPAQDSLFGSTVNNTVSQSHRTGLSADHNGTKGRNISDFITPDGRFDLRAVRRSGYQGALDMKGYRTVFDSISGQPIFRPAGPADTDDVYWDNSISPSVNGVSGVVYATTVYNGLLIIGGYFTAAGGVAANNIAAWDGSSWSPLGSGMSGSDGFGPSVFALTVYNNKLIAGGKFTAAGGVAANKIAAWNGSSWSPLGSGMSGYYPYSDAYVQSLTVYNNKLIAGGEFTTAGGVAANNIAAWDGSSWSPLGSGMSGIDPNTYVQTLTVYNNKLIAGGRFTAAGGVAANNIAAWNGSSWSPLGSGTNGDVYALTVYNNQLIAGGGFTTAGGMGANHIAAWDGSSWSLLGSGTGLVQALTVYDNNLIVEGVLTTAGGVAANNIAAWNGSSWGRRWARGRIVLSMLSISITTG